MTLKEDMVGKGVRITKSSNKSLEGIEGKVLDETKNTYLVKKSDGQQKKVFKHNCVFEIKGQRFDGKKMCLKAHEHVKIRWKKN